MSRAFTASEQRDIQSALIQSEVLPYPYGGEKPYTVKTTDKVYLLDEADMMNPSFGFSSAEEDDVSRIAYVTDYVIDAYNGETKAGTYLLRAPGHWSYGNYQSSEISQTGGIGHWYHTWNRGVRPVIRVVKSSSNLSSKKPVPKEESIEYKVTLDACKGYFDGNKKVSEKKYSVTYGKKYPKFPSPKRSKYVFDGWYTKKTGGTKVTTASTVTKKTGHTLYAHWSKKTAISKAQIKINACTYNGQKQQPAVTVTLNGKTLKKGTDFTLSYSNNIQASSNAKVVITGKGKYNGTRTVKFKIQRCPIDNEHIQCDLKTRDYVYGGGEKKPIVILFHNGSRMTEGKKHDYTFQYKNNVQPGVASVVISGRGNYTGTRTVTFTIAKATQRITYLDSISKTYKEIKKTYKLNVKGVKEWAKVTYKSSNTNVASVSTSGKVRINGVGEAKITISCAETKHYKACKKVVPVVVKGETKIKTTYAKPFAYGKKEKLTVTTDSNGKVTFSSADSSIVKIDKNSGEMTAVKPGTTKITVSVAEDLKHTATSKKVNVTVEKEQQIIEAVDIKKTKSDGDFNIGARLIQGNGKLSYKSLRPDILSVDSRGNAKINSSNVKESITVEVIISVSGTSYYTAASKTITVRINKYDLNDECLYVKQQTDYTCTLAATIMMMRRKAVISDLNWQEIKEAGEGKTNDLENAAWINGVGLKDQFNFAGINVRSMEISSQNRDFFVNMLSYHPEGIVIYDREIPHAILLTDYDSASGIMYCADSDTNRSIPIGRIRLNQSYFFRAREGESNETHMERVLKNVDKIWFIE